MERGYNEIQANKNDANDRNGNDTQANNQSQRTFEK